MLVEACRYLTTPCSSYARKLGYLSESIAIDARYRRCKTHWAEHLAHSKRCMLEAANTCQNHRKVVILGSGGLYDVPLKELSQMFNAVLLVDIIHPVHAKREAKGLNNVILLEHDITELSKAPHSFPPKPSFLLDDRDVDLVISANILSQLALLPAREFERQGANAQTLQHYSRDITTQHLAYLAEFSAVTCLITDIERLTHSKGGQLVHCENAIYNLPLPEAQQQWLWHIAPLGESSKDHALSHRVAGYISHYG